MYLLKQNKTLKLLALVKIYCNYHILNKNMQLQFETNIVKEKIEKITKIQNNININKKTLILSVQKHKEITDIKPIFEYICV